MSRTVPSDPRQEWPYQGRNQGHGGGQGVPDGGYGDMTGASDSEHDAQQYGQAYDQQSHDGQG